MEYDLFGFQLPQGRALELATAPPQKAPSGYRTGQSSSRIVLRAFGAVSPFPAAGFAAIPSFPPLLRHCGLACGDRALRGATRQSGKAEQVARHLASRMFVGKQESKGGICFGELVDLICVRSSIRTAGARPRASRASLGNHEGSSLPKSPRAVTTSEKLGSEAAALTRSRTVVFLSSSSKISTPSMNKMRRRRWRGRKENPRARCAAERCLQRKPPVRQCAGRAQNDNPRLKADLLRDIS